MNFVSFLEQSSTPSFWTITPRVCFSGKTYHPFFFNAFLEVIKKNSQLRVKSLNYSAISTSELTNTLSQSFLGDQYYLWLGDISEITKVHKQYTLAYFLNYKGPHAIIFFSSEPPADNHAIILEEILTQQTIKPILSYLYPTPNKKIELIFKAIFSKITTLDLNAVCKLTHYIELIGSKDLEESVAYLLAVTTTPEHSMFELSESFFSMNKKKFFMLWSFLEKDYPPIFWLAFWSEQIWRAYYVCLYLEKKDFVAAKKMSFKLPRNFTTQSWKNFSRVHLQFLYKNLYNIDFCLKKGSSFYSLDLMYLSHFNLAWRNNS